MCCKRLLNTDWTAITRMQSILMDGLAYKPLLAENGMYHNHFGLEVEDFGKQKHPDQLFPLTHTPLGLQHLVNLTEGHTNYGMK